jgi:hypothetical protein
MKQFHDHFDDLHFTETRLGTPEIDGRTLSIPVQGLLPMMGHPSIVEGVQLLGGRLVFRGVATSKRTLTEYIGDPRTPEGFKNDYIIEDLPPSPDKAGTCRMFLFEGLLEDPVAWVDWDILAESFELVVE